MKKKLWFALLFFVIIILVISYFLFFSEKKCKNDSDCIFDDCCNPTECVLKNKTSLDCSSILVCENPPPAVECSCVEGICIMS
jgi:hypothetical protein